MYVRENNKSLTTDEMMLLGGEDRESMLMPFVSIKVKDH